MRKRNAEECEPCDRCEATGRVAYKLGVTWWDDCPKCLGEGCAPEKEIKNNRLVELVIFLILAILLSDLAYQLIVTGEVRWAE